MPREARSARPQRAQITPPRPKARVPPGAQLAVRPPIEEVMRRIPGLSPPILHAITIPADLERTTDHSGAGGSHKGVGSACAAAAAQVRPRAVARAAAPDSRADPGRDRRRGDCDGRRCDSGRGIRDGYGAFPRWGGARPAPCSAATRSGHCWRRKPAGGGRQTRERVRAIRAPSCPASARVSRGRTITRHYRRSAALLLTRRITTMASEIAGEAAPASVPAQRSSVLVSSWGRRR